MLAAGFLKVKTINDFIPALSTRQNAYVPPCGPDRPLNPSLRPWYIYTGFCLDYVGDAHR